MAGAMNSSAIPNSLRPAPGLLFLTGPPFAAWTEMAGISTDSLVTG